MKVSYDEEVDACYIIFYNRRPDTAVEIEEGIILHITNDKKIVSMEILNASKKFPIRSLFRLEVPMKAKSRRKS